MVDDTENLLLFVEFNLDLEVAELTLEFSVGSQGLQFLGSVYGIRDKFAEENFMIRI